MFCLILVSELTTASRLDIRSLVRNLKKCLLKAPLKRVKRMSLAPIERIALDKLACKFVETRSESGKKPLQRRTNCGAPKNY